MFQFFVPISKVQKDRAIMRETDLRVAVYTRRGLILNLLVFSLCLIFGNFQVHEHNTAIVLMAGLLVSTLWRSYYLFRFDALYSRAPSRWRNQYFLASCLGAAWWSVILVTLTWKLGMRNETLIMWLYSVVFYSSVAAVFSPYKQFLTLYLFIGQIPAAITAIFLGNVEGVLYGFIMITFYLMLVYQGGVSFTAYWDRFEANFALRERASGLETENRSSQAKLDLKDEFLTNLGHELRSSIGDVLETLSSIDDSHLTEHQKELLSMAITDTGRQIDLVNNVVDFSRISNRSVTLDPVEFDLVRVIERFIQEASLSAHQQGVELYYTIDPNMPLRVRGDVLRLNQILGALMAHALRSKRIEHVYVEAHFEQGVSDDGLLTLIISDREKFQSEDDSKQNKESQESMQGIGLSIAKGLSECMGGNLNLLTDKHFGKRINLAVKLQVISQEEHHLGEEHRLEGKTVLLIDLPESSASFLANEITFWGMKTYVAQGREQALLRLREASAEKPVDLVLIYTRLGSMASLVLSRELAEMPEFTQLKQILAMSRIQSETPDIREHLSDYPQVTVIEKPVMRKRLYDVIVRRLLNEAPTFDEHDRGRPLGNLMGRRILVVNNHRVDQMIISAMIKKMGCYCQLAHSGNEAIDIIAQENFDVVLMDFDEKEHGNLVAVKQIREREKDNKGQDHIPIIAVTTNDLDAASSEFLEAGMDDFISKPIRFDELKTRITRWVQ